MACGWTLFAASFAVVSLIMDDMLLTAADRIAELWPWITLRRRVTVALLVLMSVIHLVPLQPDAPPSLLHMALHFGTAGCYAGAGVLEAWLLTRQIEPLLRRAHLLVGHGGARLRNLCLAASPGWLLVGVVGGIGMALDLEGLEAGAPREASHVSGLEM